MIILSASVFLILADVPPLVQKVLNNQIRPQANFQYLSYTFYFIESVTTLYIFIQINDLRLGLCDENRNFGDISAETR